MIAGFAVVAAPQGAAAQDAPPPTGAQVQEVVVTGSRIPRPNLNSPTPVQVIDARTIESTGQVNVGELVRTLPQAGVSALTTTNSNFSTRNNGFTTINLRNLGDQRTLVLVNGRRYVPGLPGSQIVNLNSVPTEFVDRIEVVTGGASSVYGSDALAGVVNIITQKHYNGFEIFGQGGQTQYGDAKSFRIGTKFGSDFADGRGNFVGTISWDKQGSIYAHNRCAEDMCIDGAAGQNFGLDFRQTFTPFFSGFIPGGVALIPRPVGANLQRVDQNGGVVPFVSSQMGFNRQALRLLQVPLENVKFSAQANYEVSPKLNFFTEATYYQGHSASDIEPDPLGSNTLYRDPATGAKLNPFCTGSGPAETCQFGVPLSHGGVQNAIISNELFNAVQAANPGANPDNLVVGFQRRLTDFGNRQNSIDTHLFRVVAGINGQLNDTTHYEASLNYGRTADDQVTHGQINWQRAAQAVDAINVGGQMVCRDPQARAQGCVPWNPFAANTATPAIVKYLAITDSYQDFDQEIVANAFLDGTIPGFSMPAGPIKYVIGGEYRKETSDNLPDAAIQSGISDVNISPETKGQFHVTEEFAELRVPILADMPLARRLELNLSGRASQYSNIGSTTAYAASLEYQPTDWLKLRGQYAKAVRAPNISELFAGPGETFPTVTDPCRNLTLTAGQPTINGANSNTAKACFADPALAARVARDGAFVPTQPELQGVDGFNQGNPNLGPEKAKTITVGALFNPHWNDWISPLSVSVDYFDIKITKAIASYGRATELNNCYAGPAFDPNNFFCQFIIRYQPGTANVGALRLVNSQIFNIATRSTRGVDVQASYNLDLNRLGVGPAGWNMGSLVASIAYTKLMSFKQQSTPTSAVVQFAGAEGLSRDKATFDLLYRNGPLQVSWRTNLVGQSCFFAAPPCARRDVNNALPAGVPDGKLGTAAFSYAQIRYRLAPKLTVFAGVDNVFNEFVRVGQGNAVTGWTTDPSTYDGIGRRWYVGFNKKF